VVKTYRSGIGSSGKHGKSRDAQSMSSKVETKRRDTSHEKNVIHEHSKSTLLLTWASPGTVCHRRNSVQLLLLMLALTIAGFNLIRS